MLDPFDDDSLYASNARRASRSWLVRIGVAAGLCSFVAAIAWSAYALMTESKPLKQQVVQVALLRPPPPPPPPPPPEQKPPEPEVKQELPVPTPEEPQQADEAPPPGEQLGLDSDGSGTGDGFGLAAKKGGRDITTIGGEGGGRSQFGWFTALVQNELQEQFQKNNRLRSADYKVVLRIWFGHDGGIERYELSGSSGNAEIDRNLKLALDDMPRLRQSPPESMPQPVKLRVTSRGAG